MNRVLRTAIILVVGSMVAAPEGPDQALAIMTRVVANTAAASDARRQYVYRQIVRAAMSHSNGELVRKETREYRVVPQESATEKIPLSFSGEYRDGKRMALYSQPGVRDNGDQGDRESIAHLVDELVQAKDTRDGIPNSLFPLHADDLGYYRFSLKSETMLRGRRAYDIVFVPASTNGVCIHVGGDEDNPCHQWKGEAWIDAEDYQPVRIETRLAKGIPWGVRLLMGIDVRQYGFSINYQRVAANVWFPVSYGTEFGLTVFWGYKRTISLSLENNDFRRTDSSSIIHYDVPQ